MTERSCNAEALLTEVIRLVLDQVPLLVQVVRPDGSLFYVNQLWRSTLGYTETQVPTLSIFALVDAGELTHLKEVVAKVLAGESIDRAQTRFRTAQGSLVHLEGSWMRSISSGGDPVACTFFQAVSANKGEQVSRERLLAIVDETPDFICTADAKGRVLYANAALRRLLPSLTDDQKTIRLADYHSPDMQQQLEESVNAATTWGMWSGESALTDLHDRQIAVSELILANRSQSGEVDYLTVICRDITENKLAQENLREAQEQLREALKKETDAAREDPLTKVSNRRAFYELADVERSRARRYHHALSLAYIDVDGFKQVNDKFGHASGDRLLIRIASTLRHNLRSCDAVARLGGDEFAVLLPESDAHGAMGALKKLQHYLAEETAKEPCPVTFSIGVASFSEPPDTIDEMIRAADDLMYQVKTSGKNNLRVMEVCRAQTGSTSI